MEARFGGIVTDDMKRFGLSCKDAQVWSKRRKCTLVGMSGKPDIPMSVMVVFYRLNLAYNIGKFCHCHFILGCRIMHSSCNSIIG